MDEAIEKSTELTWRELKEFINALPDEQLSNSVIWWGEERGGIINTVFVLEEDYVRTEEGCEPLSVQEPLEEGDEELQVILKKGYPILSTDF
jgi:hypothetical protein